MCARVGVAGGGGNNICLLTRVNFVERKTRILNLDFVRFHLLLLFYWLVASSPCPLLEFIQREGLGWINLIRP